MVLVAQILHLNSAFLCMITHSSASSPTTELAAMTICIIGDRDVSVSGVVSIGSRRGRVTLLTFLSAMVEVFIAAGVGDELGTGLVFCVGKRVELVRGARVPFSIFVNFVSMGLIVFSRMLFPS